MTDNTDTVRVLDLLCPMHVILSQSGHIQHCGPTLQKLRTYDLIGKRFLEVFELKRPHGAHSMTDLRDLEGTRLHLQFRDAPATELKGILIAGRSESEVIVNLSFGISIVEGVRDYALTNADFAATDLTVEMLYLVEAKSAAMEASRKLNTRLQAAMIAAEEQAFTDTLTGLKNRRAMNHVLTRNDQWGTPFSVMQVDLDWFKLVNDSHGHAAGDFVLQAVARVLVEETRDEDTIVRTGGDEFAIIVADAQDEETLARIGQRIIDRLNEPILFQGQPCHVSASIGISFFQPDDGLSVEDVLEQADAALYHSKRTGRGKISFAHTQTDDDKTSDDRASA